MTERANIAAKLTKLCSIYCAGAVRKRGDHHHHHQPINVPTAGAQAFLMDHI
jgi:hypothetical protein